MARIVLLALGAAVFPLLLACVAIMLSRREPRRLLFAFYAGGVIVSVTSGVIVLNVFKDKGTALGSTASSSSPGAAIAVGAVALLLAWLMASRHGRDALDAWRRRRPPKPDAGPSWAERHLDRANAAVAFVVGAAINLPGPFYLVALGDIATGDYSRPEELGLILLFNAIMFVLLELPLVGYLVRPAQTSVRVAALSGWLNANGLRVMGWLVGAVGVSAIGQGIAAAT
jgi:hypothetical protein